MIAAQLRIGIRSHWIDTDFCSVMRGGGLITDRLEDLLWHIQTRGSETG